MVCRNRNWLNINESTINDIKSIVSNSVAISGSYFSIHNLCNGALWRRWPMIKCVHGSSLYATYHWSYAGSSCKVKQLLIIRLRICGEIEGGKIYERKTSVTCEERQELNVCKTRWRTWFNETNEGYNGIRGYRLYRVKFFDKNDALMCVHWRKSWK